MRRWKRQKPLGFLLPIILSVLFSLIIAVRGKCLQETPKQNLVPIDGRRRLSVVLGTEKEKTEPEVKPILSSKAESWNLPSVEDAEEALPTRLHAGKVCLAMAVEKLQSIPFEPNVEALEGMATLASAISRGTAEHIIGMDILLSNIISFQLRSKPVSRMFKVTQYLGSGAANVVVEIMEKSTKERIAMRILYCPYRAPIDTSGVAAFSRESMFLESRMMMQACGDTPLSSAASKRGIAVALGTAQIDGIPEIVFSDGVFVFRDVQLMERLYGDLGHLLYRVGEIRIEAKEYVARRLLLEVLHLQEAGISHNDVKWSNLFMRKDGTFLLGDFGSSSKFGKPLKNQFTDVTPAYGEPNLLIDLRNTSSCNGRPKPDPKSDMWTLGILLFELFTDGDLPYGFGESRHNLEDMSTRASNVLSLGLRPTTLTDDMNARKVPFRWQELIRRLLEPERSRRISSREVTRDFEDLYYK